MGVDDRWFLEHQSKEIDRLRSITSTPWNAATFLERKQIAETIRLPWLIKQLSTLNIDYRTDGFMRDAVEMATLVELRALKHRTRIPVPNGIHLHGIMDETGLLEEGQIVCIFIVEGKSRVVTGKNLIVSRSPANHPGDVQVVEGILPPAGSPLRSLYNIVIFSAKGKRDLPSMLGGGDLDGDRYQVIWDKGCRPKEVFSPFPHYILSGTALVLFGSFQFSIFPR